MLLSVLFSLLTVTVVAAVLLDRRLNPVSRVVTSESLTRQPTKSRATDRKGHGEVRRGLSARRLSAGAGLLLLVGSLTLAICGQWQLVAQGPGRSNVIAWLLGLVGITVLSQLTRHFGGRFVKAQNHNAMGLTKDQLSVDLPRIAFAGWSMISSVAVWRLVGPRESDDHVTDVLVLWMSAMISAVLAVGGLPSRTSLHRWRRSLSEKRSEATIVSTIVIIALLLRVFPSGSYPRSMSGDEGVFAMQAVEMIDGNINNYFAAGIMGNINFWFASSAAVMSVFGETVGGSRLLSGIIGALALLPTYVLARKHFGRTTAMLTAVILAVSHIALFFSRNTLNNVSAFLFVPLALWLLDAGLVDRRRLPALLAGFVVGLSMLFYASNRILMPIAVLYAGYAVLASGPRSRRDFYQSIRGAAPFAALGTAGFAIAAMPMLSHFRHHPGSFNSRINQVSVFNSGWLDQEADIRGESAIRILAGQFQDAALVALGGNFTGTILHPDPPLVGWPLVVPATIGLAIVTLTCWRGPHFGLAAGFWATVAGMAITIGPTEPHKLVTALSIIAILAAVGIAAVARILLDLVRAPRLLVTAPVATAVAAIVLWNLNYYFRDPDRVAAFSDPNSQVAQSIAEKAARLGPETTVYILGAPWMYYGGFQNIAFIARNAEGIDIEDILHAGSPHPQIAGPTLFAVVSGRQDELAVIRGWFPDGVEKRHSWPDWGYLYSTYIVLPDGPEKRSPPDP